MVNEPASCHLKLCMPGGLPRESRDFGPHPAIDSCPTYWLVPALGDLYHIPQRHVIGTKACECDAGMQQLSTEVRCCGRLRFTQLTARKRKCDGVKPVCGTCTNLLVRFTCPNLVLID